MSFLFTHKRGYLLGLTGVLLWISLSSSLSILSLTTDRFRSAATYPADQSLPEWLLRLANPGARRGASTGACSMACLDRPPTEQQRLNHLPLNGTPAQSLPAGLDTSSYLQIYVSHCNERIASADANPLTER
ncbi:MULTISPECIES: hypothetical protein [unclassified Spirosoma]|uniref:hypothetical protein n=1 Tax=unclassified Spirosoma TaxID=2621999 RepID=UPI000B0B2433|nr:MULTISPECIES: hypothetical protein [unclassified Spirosoma]MBN8820716.1 hypothetical protein [Spirosoma sp.]